MKKIVSLIIVAAMAFLALLPVSASESAIGWDEARELYIKAFMRCMILHKGEIPYSDAFRSYEDYSPIYLIRPNVSDVEGIVSKSYSESTSGKQYSKEYAYFEVDYQLNNGAPENIEMTMEYLKAYGNEAMTERLTHRAMQIKIYNSNDTIEIFRTDKESGKLLQAESTGAVQMWIANDISAASTDGFVDIVSLKSNSRYAVMSVVMYKNAGGISTVTVPTTETVIFENTENGWRVSGGSVFDIIIDDKAPTYIYEMTEFEALAKQAFDRFNLIQAQWVTDYSIPASTAPEIIANSNLQYQYKIPHLGLIRVIKPDAEKLLKSFSASTAGEGYSEEKVYALAVEEVNYEPGIGITFKSVADISAFGNAVMTEELTKQAMLNVSDGVELYRDYEGQLLMYTDAFPVEVRDKYFIAEYGSVTMNSLTSASMTVTLRMRTSNDTPYTCHTETINFTKTNVGWRVSGGSAFEVMLGEAEPSGHVATVADKSVEMLSSDFTPNTSDGTWIKIGIFGFGILCAVGAFYLCTSRNKRKDSDRE